MPRVYYKTDAADAHALDQNSHETFEDYKSVTLARIQAESTHLKNLALISRLAWHRCQVQAASKMSLNP